jgi:hypothetical protein
VRKAALLPIHKIDDILSGVARSDIEKLNPAHRQWLAQALRHIADIADPPPATPAEPEAGVLADLRDGQQLE